VDAAAWQSFTRTCGDLQQYTQGGGGTFVVSRQELLTYLERVEQANPDASWKQIVAALHVALYNDDALSRTLPLIPTPLFKWGPETDGLENVDLLYRAPTRVPNPDWYVPKFVRADNGEITELGHAYGAIRINLNRDRLLQDFRLSVITHGGDFWQQVLHNWILREDVNRFPPDQLRGDWMGVWLENYYRTHSSTPLSQAFEAYFSR